ncbi:V-type ATP synthase subunit I [Methanocella arvoryzae]|uniref:A-type ATP synthase subunit I n=1 Tax=Methanocella arvoryzae (strain DSM 22066 / NBRC 105507 / MRE50) TaxID=351160 RepID=Q0W368_METAR|nr:V-type ATP synthase subunit I [Methanocella arvoryzae]CAJ37175.1 A(1)A(0)-type ATP synthase, subunit I [Methanocella arvoryzae MRE50]
MLEPHRMDRVLIVGTKDVMEPTINALHDLNLLHVEDYVAEDEYFQLGKPLKSATPLSEKLLKLRSIKSYLGTKEGTPSKAKKSKVLQELEANLGSLEETVTKKTNEKNALESELKDLEHKSEVLKPYEALGLPLELLSGYESVTVFTGTASEGIENVVKGITTNYELFSAPYGKGNVIALFVPKDDAGKVSEALLKSNFVEIEQLRESGEPAAIRKRIEDGKAQAESKLEKVTGELADLNKKYAQFIVSAEELLSIDTQKAEAPIRFATSESTFVVEGWVPRDDFERLQSTVDKAADGRVYVTKIEPKPGHYEKNAPGTAIDSHDDHHEIDAPVKYNNPKIVSPIQNVIDAYGRPKYNEIDPTMIFAIVFPLFYGFIVGDIGYGLLILILMFALRSVLKSANLQILIKVMIVCAISSIFFGILFGEFLGFAIAEPIEDGHGGILGLVSLSSLYPHSITIGPIGPFSLPLERMQAGGPHDGVYVFGIKDLLVFTCIIGVAQIMLGYALGFWNELRQHGLKTAILHKVSWACVLMGGVSIVWYVFPLALTQTLGTFTPFDPLFLIGAVLFLLGIIMVLMGEGPMGLIEITSLLSNVLSYTRLLAVGLSSVGIAFAINTISMMLADAGAIGMIGAIIVFLVGHLVNLVLAMYAPFIQSLRLHFVEFFQKFYKSGGRIYNPFGYNRIYTED